MRFSLDDNFVRGLLILVSSEYVPPDPRKGGVDKHRVLW